MLTYARFIQPTSEKDLSGHQLDQYEVVKGDRYLFEWGGEDWSSDLEIWEVTNEKDEVLYELWLWGYDGGVLFEAGGAKVVASGFGSWLVTQDGELCSQLNEAKKGFTPPKEYLTLEVIKFSEDPDWTP